MTDTIQSLGKVSEIWLTPHHPLREETIHALQVSTGLSGHQIEMALTNCFEELTVAKITAYMASLNQVQRRYERKVLHILPSNVFTAWVHGAVITLLLGRDCLLKPSVREPVFARAWKKSLEDVNSKLAKQVAIVTWDEKWLKESQAVIAYGSDETLHAIQSKLPLDVRFAGYGHKLSVGIIFQDALSGTSSELLERVKNDANPFRLQGCLSPQILYIEDSAFRRWPELAAVVDVSPKIKPFTQWADVLQELEKFTPYLSCVGYAGSGERESFLNRELSEFGVSRICPLGEMQRPPLGWLNGGIHLANLLN